MESPINILLSIELLRNIKDPNEKFKESIKTLQNIYKDNEQTIIEIFELVHQKYPSVFPKPPHNIIKLLKSSPLSLMIERQTFLINVANAYCQEMGIADIPAMPQKRGTWLEYAIEQCMTLLFYLYKMYSHINEETK